MHLKAWGAGLVKGHKDEKKTCRETINADEKKMARGVVCP